MPHKKDFIIKEPIDTVAVPLEKWVKEVSQYGLKSVLIPYTGDGTALKTVKVGFYPIFVVISKNVSLNNSFPVSGNMVFSMMGNTGVSYIPGTGYVKDSITAVDKDKVTLGTNSNVNAAGVSYLLLAIG